MSEKTRKTPDRRVQRTRRMLRDALIALILERGWDATSVQDVCERADVGRSTFYTHFADKEELLTSGFDTLRKELRAGHAALSGGKAPPPLAFARSLMEHVHGEQRLFRALVGKRSGLVVQKRFRQLLLELVREDLTALTLGGVRLEATAHYLTGAFFELLIWWLDSRTALPASELEALFSELTKPVLEAALAGAPLSAKRTVTRHSHA